MPRILSQESFCRRRNSSSRLSLSLLNSLGHGGASVSTRRRTPFRNNINSKYSLTRMNKSSSSSLRQMVLSYSGYVHDISYGSSRPSSPSSKGNAGWATVSDTSSEQSEFSRTSSQSSVNQHPTTTTASDNCQSDALKRFCGALQKQQQQQQASVRRVSELSSSSGFLPLAARVQEDTTWGQFVDVADAEEELVRMSKFLSIRRHIDIIPLMENDPLDF